MTETIWGDYQAKLKTFIEKRVSDPAATDDILQDVFLKMHTQLDSLKEKAKLQSWLYQITRNAIIDYYRSKKPSETLPEWLSQAQSDPGEQARQELSECLQPMIERLPPRYRDAIVLSEIKGKTQKEVSQTQGISLSGAKSRVQRGRALLKEMLVDCCQLEYGHAGQVIDYNNKDGSCSTC